MIERTLNESANLEEYLLSLIINQIDSISANMRDEKRGFLFHTKEATDMTDCQSECDTSSSDS